MKSGIIPTSVHAVEDYLTSGTVPLAARKLGVTPATRHIMDSVAAVSGMQSLMTDYEGGLERIMPMRMHLRMDMLMGVGLIATAALMWRKPRVDRLALGGLGLVALASGLLTSSEPSHRS